MKADIVGFMVRQRRVSVQFAEPFEDAFPAGTIFVSGQNGVLIMKKNGILKKFFESEQKSLGRRLFFDSGIENLLDIAKQMRTAFLLGESSDLVPVGAVKVANNNAFVKFSQMINDDLGTPASRGVIARQARNQPIFLIIKLKECQKR